jgi:hypothetical protein
MNFWTIPDHSKMDGGVSEAQYYPTLPVQSIFGPFFLDTGWLLCTWYTIVLYIIHYNRYYLLTRSDTKQMGNTIRNAFSLVRDRIMHLACSAP